MDPDLILLSNIFFYNSSIHSDLSFICPNRKLSQLFSKMFYKILPGLCFLVVDKCFAPCATAFFTPVIISATLDMTCCLYTLEMLVPEPRRVLLSAADLLRESSLLLNQIKSRWLFQVRPDREVRSTCCKTSKNMGRNINSDH